MAPPSQELEPPAIPGRFKDEKWRGSKFDCNIQQVKIAEFDILYYG
jgi:hypothetical protein